MLLTCRHMLRVVLAVFLLAVFSLSLDSATASDRSLVDQFPNQFHEITDLPSGGATHFQLAGPVDGGRGLVVMIHGVSGPLTVWDKTVSALNDAGWRTLRYDLFGRGHSARLPDGDYGLEMYVRQLEELLLRVTASSSAPVHLVGSSMGAIVAAEFATRHPGRAVSVALIGPAGFPIQVPLLARLGDLPFVGRYLRAAILHLAGQKLVLEQNTKYFVDEPPGEFWAYFTAQLAVPGTVEAMVATMEQVPVENFLGRYNDLGHMRIPVTVIWGREDRTFPYPFHSDLLRAVPTAQLVTIERAGHLPQYEVPEATLAALLGHLSRAAATAVLAPSSDGAGGTLANTMQPSALALTEESAAAPPPVVPLPRRYAPPISMTLSTELIANQDDERFRSAFFQRFPTRPYSLELAAGARKEYQVPTRYAGTVASTGIFTADYEAAARHVAGMGFKPVRAAAMGRAIVVVSSYHYANVIGIKPYNEVAITIPVVPEGRLGLPLLPLLLPQHYFDVGAVVIAMPVTSLENQIRGVKIWGLPKTVEHVVIEEIGDELVTRVADGQLELRVPLTGDAHEILEVETSLHTRGPDGTPQSSFSVSRGGYQVMTDLAALAGLSRAQPRLAIGDRGALAELASSLKIDPRPLRTMMSHGVDSILELPQAPDSPPGVAAGKRRFWLW